MISYIFIIKNDMRIYRNLSDETKKKIADGVKNSYANKSIDDKRAAAKKRSESMKNYWAKIPFKPNGGSDETE